MGTLKYVLVGKPVQHSPNGEARGWTSYIIRGGLKFPDINRANEYINEADDAGLVPIEISEEFDLNDPASKTL